MYISVNPTCMSAHRKVLGLKYLSPKPVLPSSLREQAILDAHYIVLNSIFHPSLSLSVILLPLKNNPLSPITTPFSIKQPPSAPPYPPPLPPAKTEYHGTVPVKL